MAAEVAAQPSTGRDAPTLKVPMTGEARGSMYAGDTGVLPTPKTAAAAMAARSHSNMFEAPDPLGLAGLSARQKRLAQRRCVAEDPEWNLAVVEKLSELCIRAFVAGFEKAPKLNRVPTKYRERVLDALPVDLPLRLTASLIPDESYWRRAAAARFTGPAARDVRRHGGSWKRLFFELQARARLEAFEPRRVGGRDALMELLAELRLAAPFVHELQLRQLRPEKSGDDEDGTGGGTKATDPPPDHVPLGLVVTELSNLTELRVYFGVLDAGMDYDRRLYGMTQNDAVSLCAGVKGSRTLRCLVVQSAEIDDDRARLLANALLENKSLRKLDVSHNRIGDAGATALAGVLATPTAAPLEELELGNNRVGAAGAAALGRALARRRRLRRLGVRMNTLGDSGGAALLAGLLADGGEGALFTSSGGSNGGGGDVAPPGSAGSARDEVEQGGGLRFLDAASAGLGAASVEVLCRVLRRNGRALTGLDLSCNRFADGGGGGGSSVGAAAAEDRAGVADIELVGKMLFDAISHNKYVTQLDLRGTDLSVEHLAAIRGIVGENSAEELGGGGGGSSGGGAVTGV